MKLIEAQKRIEKLAYIPFKEYLTEEQFNNIVVNKGKTGQILELTIGLQLSNTTLDFEDGELKLTNVINSEFLLKQCLSHKPHLLLMNYYLSSPLKKVSYIKKSIECYMFASTKKERLRIGCFCHLY